MLFKGNANTGFKFFDEYYSDKNSTGILPKIKDCRKSKMDTPLQIPQSQLCVYRTKRSNKIPKHLGKPYAFAWITDSGIIHGKITSDENKFLAPFNTTVIETIPKDTKKKETPFYICLTQFHIFVFYEKQIDVFLQPAELPTVPKGNNPVLSQVIFSSYHGRVIGVEPFLDPYNEPIQGVTIINLEQEFLELCFTDPNLDMWRIYLERAQDPKSEIDNPEDIPRFFFIAFKLCGFREEDKERVKSAEGDYYFQKGNYKAAGLAYAKTKIPFEEIVTKFMNKGEGDVDGLRIYMEDIFFHLPNALTHTPLAIWLTELYCDRVNYFNNLIHQKYDIECTDEEKKN